MERTNLKSVKRYFEAELDRSSFGNLSNEELGFKGLSYLSKKRQKEKRKVTNDSVCICKIWSI